MSLPPKRSAVRDAECASRSELATDSIADLTARIFELQHALNRAPHDLTSLCAGEEHQEEDDSDADD